jgi:hypothetical protein
MIRLRRRAIAAMVAVFGTVALLTPAAPAMAAPHTETYAFVNDHEGFDIGYIDINGVEVTICRVCGYGFHFDTKSQPGAVAQVNKGVLGGLQFQAKAAAATNEAVAARYQALADAQFAAAARAAGPEGVAFDGAGIVDTAKQVFNPDPVPWLADAGQHLTNGINYLVRANADPEPSPWRAAAAREFRIAFKELVTKTAIGG